MLWHIFLISCSPNLYLDYESNNINMDAKLQQNQLQLLTLASLIPVLQERTYRAQIWTSEWQIQAVSRNTFLITTKKPGVREVLPALLSFGVGVMQLRLVMFTRSCRFIADCVREAGYCVTFPRRPGPSACLFPRSPPVGDGQRTDEVIVETVRQPELFLSALSSYLTVCHCY